jgi:hypothetical protein
MHQKNDTGVRIVSPPHRGGLRGRKSISRSHSHSVFREGLRSRRVGTGPEGPGQEEDRISPSSRGTKGEVYFLILTLFFILFITLPQKPAPPCHPHK